MLPKLAHARSTPTLTRAAALAALALTACPGETGRQRGPIDGGDGGSVAPPCPSSSPSSGACPYVGQTCRYTTTTGCPGGVRAEVCQCLTGSRWSCSPGPCTVPRRDAGDACPISSLVSSGDSCPIELAGVTCMGSGLDCAGNEARVPCYCGGSNWSCQQPFCPDASPPDDGVLDAGPSDPRCPPEPQPGLMCGGEPFSCRYPAGPTCELACRCEEGVFLCENTCDGGPDAGADVPFNE